MFPFKITRNLEYICMDKLPFLSEASFGFGVLSLPLSVCVCSCVCVYVNLKIVCTITYHPFKPEPSNSEKKENTLVKIPIVLGVD